MTAAHRRVPDDDDGLLLDRFFDRFVERLAVELADRIDQRLDRLAATRTQQGPVALDVKQAAARLGVSERTVWDLINSEQLRSVKVGRRRLIASSAIERLLGEQAGS